MYRTKLEGIIYTKTKLKNEQREKNIATENIKLKKKRQFSYHARLPVGATGGGVFSPRARPRGEDAIGRPSAQRARLDRQEHPSPVYQIYRTETPAEILSQSLAAYKSGTSSAWQSRR